MSNVIVTGANGFVGRNLIKNLIDKDFEVTALDIQFSEELKKEKKVTCVECNLFEIKNLNLERNNYDYFIHLAWTATSGAGRGDYSAQLRNVKMTCDCVKIASSLNCKKFIYASSINEVETYEYLNMNDVRPGLGYIYGTGKLAAHLMGETVAYQEQIGFIPVLITNIYGAGEKSARLINSSIRKLMNNEHCSFTEGNQLYDFIYIDDAIGSIISIIEKGKAFNLYYIGSGNPKPLKDYLIEMKDIVNPSNELGLGEIPFNGAMVDYSQFELNKVFKDTGYQNKIEFSEGIKMTMDYILKENENVTKI